MAGKAPRSPADRRGLGGKVVSVAGQGHADGALRRYQSRDPVQSLAQQGFGAAQHRVLLGPLLAIQPAVQRPQPDTFAARQHDRPEMFSIRPFAARNSDHLMDLLRQACHGRRPSGRRRSRRDAHRLLRAHALGAPILSTARRTRTTPRGLVGAAGAAISRPTALGRQRSRPVRPMPHLRARRIKPPIVRGLSPRAPRTWRARSGSPSRRAAGDNRREDPVAHRAAAAPVTVLVPGMSPAPCALATVPPRATATSTALDQTNPKIRSMGISSFDHSFDCLTARVTRRRLRSGRSAGVDGGCGWRQSEPCPGIPEPPDHPEGRPDFVAGGGSNASDARRGEQDDVVMVGVVVDAGNPAWIGVACVREGSAIPSARPGPGS